MRVIGIAAAVVSGLGIPYVVLSAWINGPRPESDVIFTLATLALVSAFFVISLVFFFGAGAGAVRCTVDDAGVTLNYNGGRLKQFPWHDSHLRIKLAKVTSNAGLSYDLLTTLPSHNPLSSEAYDAVIAKAISQRVDVRAQEYHGHGLAITTTALRPSPVNDSVARR